MANCTSRSFGLNMKSDCAKYNTVLSFVCKTFLLPHGTCWKFTTSELKYCKCNFKTLEQYFQTRHVEASTKDDRMFWDHWHAYCHQLNIDPYLQQEPHHHIIRTTTIFLQGRREHTKATAANFAPLSPLPWTQLCGKIRKQLEPTTTHTAERAQECWISLV